MKYFIIVIVLLIYSSGLSQTKFEDAAALNYKNTNIASAGFFDKSGSLNVAKIITKDGSYFLETGVYDLNGAYSSKKMFEMNSYTTEFKIKFSADGSKLAVLELSSDKNLLSFFDLSSGSLIQDFDAEEINDFFLTPDSKYIVATGSTNSVLFDIYEDNILFTYSGLSVLDISEDGNTIFCKNGSNIEYIETKTGKKLRTFPLKDYRSIEFDSNGELILCSFNGSIKLFKLTQASIITVKEINNVSIKPIASPYFNYFFIDETGKRMLFNLGGKLVYKSKIENYSFPKCNYVFSSEEKYFALLSDKGTEVYDFDVMKYYDKLSQKHPDLFLSNVQFETEQDQINRADRFKIQKQVLVSNIADEMKVSEGIIKQNQKNSLGLVEVKIYSIGMYDPNTEMYDVTLVLPVDFTNTENVNAKVKVPKFQAEIFSQNFSKFKSFALRQLNKNQTGLDVFDVVIINDLNNSTYRCIMHRTLPVNKSSYDLLFTNGQKSFEQRNWYETIINLSDFPEDYSKNSVVDFMLNQSITNFFEEKWSYVQTLNPVRDSTILLQYISDFPKSFKLYLEVKKLQQIVVNSIMESRMDKANSYISDKMFSDALDYINSSITQSYYDVFSNSNIEYEYYFTKLIPTKNKLLVIIAKRSMEGGNFSRALELLNQVTKDYTEYSEVEKLITEINSQKK